MLANDLTVTRKADRAQMIARLEELIIAAGATFERVDEWRKTSLAIRAPGGLQVNVALDAQRRDPNTHVLSWHMSLDSEEKLVLDFRGVNKHHFRKATHVAYGFDSLCEQLGGALALAASAEAYQGPREGSPAHAGQM